MNPLRVGLFLSLSVMVLTGVWYYLADDSSGTAAHRAVSRQLERVARHAVRSVRDGRDVFRYDTFEDEVFWGDTPGLHGSWELQTAQVTRQRRRDDEERVALPGACEDLGRGVGIHRKWPEVVLS